MNAQGVFILKSRSLVKLERFKTADWGIVIILFVYRVFLDLLYIQYVHPYFDYYHFELNYNVTYLISSYFLCFSMIFFVPNLLKKARLADLIMALLIVMYFIPYTTIFAYCSQEVAYAIFVLFFLFLMLIFNNAVDFQNKRIKYIDRNMTDSKLFVILMLGCCFIAILVSGVYAGFRISFDLSEYYEYRALARENAMPSILNYLYNWSVVGLDIGLAYCLIKKKKVLSIIVILSNLLAFSYNGKKSVLFTLIIVVLVSLIYKSQYLKLIPYGFGGLTIVAYIEFLIRGSDAFIVKHFIRRMLLIPPFMGTLYYDFFSTHEFDYLRLSVLRRFGFTSPYAAAGKIPRLIGQEYFGNVGIMAMNANTGLCGDAYSNFGFWSLLIAPLATILVFKIMESYAKNVDERIKVIVAVLVAYSYVNGAFFTLLLTNGMIFLCFLLWALSCGQKTS